MSHFILVHGVFDSSSGADNIDRAAPRLLQLGNTVDTDGEDYGLFGPLKARFGRYTVVGRLVIAIRKAIDEGKNVVLVGYSNGANFSLQALELVFNGKVKLILVHPAVKTKFQLPASVSRCWVCYTKSDWATRISSYVGWLVPGWGRAGAVGYKGSDPRVTNVNYTNVAALHGGIWSPHWVQAFADDLHYFASLEAS